MDEQVEGSSEHEVQLVPPAAVPVQAGPGYHSLGRPEFRSSNKTDIKYWKPLQLHFYPRYCSRKCVATAGELEGGRSTGPASKE